MTLNKEADCADSNNPDLEISKAENEKEAIFLNREEKIITKAFCELFNQDVRKIIRLKLFDEPDIHLARIFESLSKMTSGQFVTVVLFMEFLLNSEKSAKELIDDLKSIR